MAFQTGMCCAFDAFLPRVNCACLLSLYSIGVYAECSAGTYAHVASQSYGLYSKGNVKVDGIGNSEPALLATGDR